MTKTVANPRYTMGAAAPYNYFYNGTAEPMTANRAADGSVNTPFPFKAGGQGGSRQASAPSGVGVGARAGNHG